MFEKYDAYKDSGIDWIGDIPADWDALKLKNVAFINPTNTALSNSLDKNTQVCFLAMENVEADGTVNYQNKRRLASVKSGFTNFIKNDVLVAKITPCFENGKGALLDQLDSEIGFGSTEFHVLRSKHNSHPKFLYYLTKSHNFMDFGEGMMIGSAGQKRVPTDFIENFSLALPNKTLQGEIAKFLDAKTSEIEQVIAIKEQQIALLNERKQIVIQKAVTQGLDPSVPMKDSGLNGVGNIHQDWEIIKFKYLAKVRYGLGQPPRQLDNGLKIIRATNVERGKIVEKGMLYIDPNDIPWDRNPTLNKDEIIVVRSGAYTGDSAIVTEEYAGCIAGYDMVATPFNCYPKFLSTVLLSHYVLYGQIYLLRMRSAQPHLNAEELNELQIVVPPINQQRLIANYIEKVESDISEAISLIKQQLEKLKEYKTTLINDAVTGKIKVA